LHREVSSARLLARFAEREEEPMKNNPPAAGDPSPFDERLPRLAESDTWPNGDPWLDLATEFRQPERSGRWSVLTNREPWQIVDGRGELRFLCDERATVYRGDGGELFRIEPNHLHDVRGQLFNATVGGLFGGLFGSSSSDDIANDRRRQQHERDQAPRAWTIREEGALIIAKAAAVRGGVHIEPLPSSWMNDKVVAVRATPHLAAYIRRLGPLSYRVTAGDDASGRGELRGPAGHVIATDQFACAPVRDSAMLRYGIIRWSIDIANNPFPPGWLFAMLRAPKSIAW
jgi:hypothetical protein